MSGFENDVMVAKNMNFDEAAAKPHLGMINAAGKFPIGTGNTFPTPEILGGSLTSPNSSITFGYSSPNITAVVNTAVITDLHTARYIVSAGGAADGANYTTIAAAYAAAVGATGSQTVFVQPGTYTENITLSPNVNICAFPCDANDPLVSGTPNVTIIGTLTATFSGTCSLSGLCLQTNSATVITISGANPTNVYLSGCYINATNNSAILMSSSGGANLELFQCNGNLATTGIHFFDVTGATAQLLIHNGVYNNTGNSTSVSTISSSGKLQTRYVEIYNAFTSSSTAAVSVFYSTFRNPSNVGCTFGGTGTNSAFYTRFEGGTSTALTVGAGVELDADYISVDSSNTNAIDGTGTLKYGKIVYTSTSSKNNVTTATPYTNQGITTAANQIVYSTTNNVLAGLASANNGVLTTGTTGIPAITALVSNGQLIIGSGSGAPIASTLSAGTGISITNAANSITIAAASGGFTWSETSGAFNAVKQNGYFITTTATATLPASPSEGDTISFIVDSTNLLTITANTGQTLRFSSAVSASAGTAVSTKQGDSATLVYKSTGTVWIAQNFVGNWTLT